MTPRSVIGPAPDSPSSPAMRETTGHIYDFPKYYDLVYGSDWKAEFDFLRATFERHATDEVRSLLEPACGTGRLLYRFAEAGYDVCGNDLNEKAVAYCNARLKRHGHAETAHVGDMSAFTLRDVGRKKPVDAAFNMINSVRHLPSDEAALAHLKCVADAIRPGGLYVLGLHLTPTDGERIEHESWSATRGNLTVVSSLWSEGIDIPAREEQIGMRYDVYTLTDAFSISDQMIYRIYTREHLDELLQAVPELETVAVHDFAYDLESESEIDAGTEDVVLVLRKRG